jgi:UDP-N-acetylmuramoyl-L-alanyl-D-glutamate--2,6-diaminopimelate ligase
MLQRLNRQPQREEAMNLDQLLAGLPGASIQGSRQRPISGLAYDSRHVQPGGMFVAIHGYHVDGHTYIPQALERGATAVVVDARHWSPEHAPLPADCTLVVVPDSRVALAPLAAAYYGYPGRHLGVVGVTGTKGKTTTSGLISRALESGGHVTGLINSVDFQVGARQWPNTTRQSTPEAPDIQALLREMTDAGCGYAVLEATSHGLSPRWNRVGCCAFDVAVLTNLSHEHLDFHGTFERYRADKARLFEMLGDEPPPGAQVPGLPPAKAQKYALVNADDPQHRFFLDAAPASAHRLTYGIDAPADVRASRMEATAGGTALHVDTPWGSADMQLRLPGTFNVHNALAALSAALTQGVPLDAAAQALGGVEGVRGRMERIAEEQPFEMIVDYAHNPDSFTRVFEMVRPLVAGQIIAVFGSAGERDREKRPLQGAVAARFCDLLILTDEDPRREDPGLILAEIAAGAEPVGTPYLSIPDRREAIRTACERARPGDMVLLLGKGHETSIEYADGKHPWDEAAEARAALRELGWSRA